MKGIAYWALAITLGALALAACTSGGESPEVEDGYLLYTDSAGVKVAYRVAQDTLHDGEYMLLPQVLVTRKDMGTDSTVVYNPSDLFHGIIDYDTEELVDMATDSAYKYIVAIGRFRCYALPDRDDEYGHFDGEPETSEYYIIGVNMADPAASFFISPLGDARFTPDRRGVSYTLDGKLVTKPTFEALAGAGDALDLPTSVIDGE